MGWWGGKWARNTARFASAWIPQQSQRRRHQRRRHQRRRHQRATRQKTSVVLVQKNTKGTRTATTRTTTVVATTMVAIAAPKPWWGGKWARNTASSASVLIQKANKWGANLDTVRWGNFSIPNFGFVYTCIVCFIIQFFYFSSDTRGFFYLFCFQISYHLLLKKKKKKKKKKKVLCV